MLIPLKHLHAATRDAAQAAAFAASDTWERWAEYAESDAHWAALRACEVVYPTQERT